MGLDTRSSLKFITDKNQLAVGLALIESFSSDTELFVKGDIENTGGINSESNLSVNWSGSNTVGDGLTNLTLLTATNSETDKSSDAGFVLKNGRTGKQWNFRTTDSGDGFATTQQGTDVTEFKVINDTGVANGTKLYVGNGASCVNGVWTNKSSRSSKENIVTLSTKDALSTFRKLEPVVYNYKTDKSEKYVGFIAEDVPELVAVNSRDGLSAMDMVAVLTKVVQEQDKKIEKLELNQKELNTLKKRLSSLESILTNLAFNIEEIKNEKISSK